MLVAASLGPGHDPRKVHHERKPQHDLRYKLSSWFLLGSLACPQYAADGRLAVKGDRTTSGLGFRG